jgi:hypothetical protein
MVEMVARALCVDAEDDPEEIIGQQPQWKLYKEAAKAALAVVREAIGK